MSLAESNLIWQILEEHGVTEHDLMMLSKYRKTFAASVAKALKRGTELTSLAIGGPLTEALRAVQETDDVEMLEHIYSFSAHQEIWVAAIERITDLDMDKAYHLVRVSWTPERADACLRAARRFSKYYLDQLCSPTMVSLIPAL